MTEQLKALALKATPGPWWIDSHGMSLCSKAGKLIFMTDGRMGAARRNPETGCLSRWPNDHDATYIATTSPDVVLGLIDKIDYLESYIEAQKDSFAIVMAEKEEYRKCADTQAATHKVERDGLLAQRTEDEALMRKCLEAIQLYVDEPRWRVGDIEDKLTARLDGK